MLQMYRVCGSILRRFSSVSSGSKFKFLWCESTHKSYIKVTGPDSIKFLNGLVTSKLQPTFVKKNLTTITEKDQGSTSIPLQNLDLTRNNWGLFKECNSMATHISRFATYTGFLNSKGKLLTDSIIYPYPFILNDIKDHKFPIYLLEFDSNVLSRMQKVLDNHKILSKVKLKQIDLGKLKTWDICIDMPSEYHLVENLVTPMEQMQDSDQALYFAKFFASTFFQGNEDKLLGVYFDTRLLDDIINGKIKPMFRVVTDNTVSNISEIFNCTTFDGGNFEISEISHEELQRDRFKFGLFDGYDELLPNTILPLEANFDFFEDTISSDKGCYVGQELTARTFATGVLKKRCVGITIDDSEKLSQWDHSKYLNIFSKLELDIEKENKAAEGFVNPFSNSTKPIKKRTRPAGQLINNQGDIGIAVFRKEYVHHALSHRHDIDGYIELPSGEKLSCKMKLEWLDRFRQEDEAKEK